MSLQLPADAVDAAAPSEVEAKARHTFLSAALQQRLAHAGTYTGAIDGQFGPKSFAALLAYAAGCSVTGGITARGQIAAAHYAEYGLTASPERLAEFLAQIVNETGGFTRNVENLNYTSAAQIRKTWPTRFRSDAEALPYVKNAQALANRVYARPEEGNARPGDGWRYRGRGDLQLTFANNYRTFGKLLGLDLFGNPDLAAVPDVSHLIALAFWRAGAVNAAVDDSDFVGARRITNMGSRYAKGTPIGLDHVAALRGRILEVLHA
jgi:putative chitinase